MFHMSRSWVAAPLALLLVTPASGMTVRKRDFPDLVARAEQIVIGTATAIREGEDVSGAPATFVTFSDLSVLKGSVEGELTLRFYGGGSGRYVVRIPDMPQFQVGERAVLFVAGNGRDMCPLVGVWQGRFRVRVDAALGTEVVDDHAGRPVLGVNGRDVEVAGAGSGGGASLPMTLDAFRQQIADEISAPSATD
jgi:hypothetical protein